MLKRKSKVISPLAHMESCHNYLLSSHAGMCGSPLQLGTDIILVKTPMKQVFSPLGGECLHTNLQFG